MEFVIKQERVQKKDATVIIREYRVKSSATKPANKEHDLGCYLMKTIPKPNTNASR